MTHDQLLEMLNTSPEQVQFADVIAVIDENYDYTPTGFTNGLGDHQAVSAAGSNEGSCKIFAFADMNDLNPAQTLACFGDYYRKDVLDNLTGTDHANIRNFMRSGWDGVFFDQAPLVAK